MSLFSVFTAVLSAAVLPLLLHAAVTASSNAHDSSRARRIERFDVINSPLSLHTLPLLRSVWRVFTLVALATKSRKREQKTTTLRPAFSTLAEYCRGFG